MIKIEAANKEQAFKVMSEIQTSEPVQNSYEIEILKNECIKLKNALEAQVDQKETFKMLEDNKILKSYIKTLESHFNNNPVFKEALAKEDINIEDFIQAIYQMNANLQTEETHAESHRLKQSRSGERTPEIINTLKSGDNTMIDHETSVSKKGDQINATPQDYGKLLDMKLTEKSTPLD